MHGSSGDHAWDKHTRAEVELVDAALTELRRRHGFRDLVLSGNSAASLPLACRRGGLRASKLTVPC